MLILTDPKKICRISNLWMSKLLFLPRKKHKQDVTFSNSLEPNIIQALETRHPQDLATKHENEAGVGMNFLDQES